MAARLETLSPLGRKLFIEVSADEVIAEQEKRIKRLMQTAQIDGFRKGKVPHKIIKQRYGEEIFGEAINDLLRNSLNAAFDEHALHPAGTPRVENLEVSKESPLRYEVTFDIYPDITLADLSQVTLERNAVVISDDDVAQMLEKLRKQQADWNPVERAALEGDKLIVDVKVDAEGASVKDMHQLPVELGSGNMIPGFEDGLIGAKVGDDIILHLTFPTPYFDESLAGKRAKFTIHVGEVLAPESISDERLAEKLAIEGGIDALKEEVRAQVQRQVNQSVKGQLKSQLWDKLVNLHDFEIPNSLIEGELHRLLHPDTSHDDGHHHHDASEAQRQEATRRVKIGLLFSKVVKDLGIEPDFDRMRAKIEEMFAVFENPEQMAKHYYQNKEFLKRVQADTLEEQAIDELLKQVQINDKAMRYSELFGEGKN